MANKIDINVKLVESLIKEQFPDWSNLAISQVELSGWDNRTFRLGENMLVRLPSAEGYVAQVLKEQEWLPKLGRVISLQIPKPIALGKPSNIYSWNFSIYNWIPGFSVNQLELSSNDLEHLAKDLADFINELHKAPTEGAPEGGLHNYYRGCHPSVYDKDARSDIEKLSDIIDSKKSLQVWESAIASQWEQKPVWVHGDMAIGNLRFCCKLDVVI